MEQLFRYVQNFQTLGCDDLLWSRITSIPSRSPGVGHCLHLHLKQWLLNKTLLTLSELVAWHFFFWPSSVGQHPPNCSQAQDMCPQASRAISFHQCSTRSLISLCMNTSCSVFLFLALLHHIVKRLVRTCSTFQNRLFLISILNDLLSCRNSISYTLHRLSFRREEG